MKPDDAWRSLYFGGGRLPPSLEQQRDREEAAHAEQQRQLEATEAERLERARWVAEVAAELLGGPPAGLEARLFVGSALEQRVRGTIDDVEKALRLRPRRGSKVTAARLLSDAASSR